MPAAITDIQFNPIYQGEYHQIAVAAGDIFIYNFKVPAHAFVDEYPNRIPITTRKEYQSTRVSFCIFSFRKNGFYRLIFKFQIAQLGMGDIKRTWRIRFNLTGNVLVASSGDGTVRVFKCKFAI